MRGGSERPITTVTIKRKTFNRLEKLFMPRESWDDFLNRLAGIAEGAGGRI